MHFDITEALRQKQQKQLRSIRIENGKVIVKPGVLPSLEPEEEIDPADIALPDD